MTTRLKRPLSQPLKYYLPSLLWFQERQKEEGLEIPYIFQQVLLCLALACLESSLTPDRSLTAPERP